MCDFRCHCPDFQEGVPWFKDFPPLTPDQTAKTSKNYGASLPRFCAYLWLSLKGYVTAVQWYNPPPTTPTFHPPPVTPSLSLVSKSSARSPRLPHRPWLLSGPPQVQACRTVTRSRNKTEHVSVLPDQSTNTPAEHQLISPADTLPSEMQTVQHVHEFRATMAPLRINRRQFQEEECSGSGFEKKEANCSSWTLSSQHLCPPCLTQTRLFTQSLKLDPAQVLIVFLAKTESTSPTELGI